MRYKVVNNGKNIFGKETFKRKSDAREAIYYANKGARFLKVKSAAYGARIIKIKKKK